MSPELANLVVSRSASGALGAKRTSAPMGHATRSKGAPSIIRDHEHLGDVRGLTLAPLIGPTYGAEIAAGPDFKIRE
jgi:hypothetical protein